MVIKRLNEKDTIMRAAVRMQEFGAISVQTVSTKEPKRLSKLGQWMRNNPGGIITVIDRKAVNR